MKSLRSVRYRYPSSSTCPTSQRVAQPRSLKLWPWSSQGRGCTRSWCRSAPEVDQSRLAHGQLPPSSADVDLTPDGTAYRSGVRQRILWADPGHAHPLGARVVLLHDRSPPLNMRRLTSARRARRHGRPTQRRDVVTGTHLVGHLASGRTWWDELAWVTRCSTNHAVIPRVRSAPSRRRSPPIRWTVIDHTSGAEWYSGGGRDTHRLPRSP